jgi:hypothetical protein
MSVLRRIYSPEGPKRTKGEIILERFSNGEWISTEQCYRIFSGNIRAKELHAILKELLDRGDIAAREYIPDRGAPKTEFRRIGGAFQ